MKKFAMVIRPLLVATAMALSFFAGEVIADHQAFRSENAEQSHASPTLLQDRDSSPISSANTHAPTFTIVPTPSMAVALALKDSPTPSASSQAFPFSQAVVVLVVNGGYLAKVVAIERVGSNWKLKLKTDGTVGKYGLVDSELKKEGDLKTPKGLYNLGPAFGMKEVNTALQFRLITKNSYWVDDPESKYYNTWQEGYKGWKSAEKLSAIMAYYYAAVIQYNALCVPGKGSAIFLHCGAGHSTAGCVAIPKNVMKILLNWFDSSCNPVIIIGNSTGEISNYSGIPQSVFEN